MKKRWPWLGVVLLPFVAIAALVLYRDDRIRGYVTGQPHFKGQSASYWRGVLAESGPDGQLSTDLSARFDSGEAAPVLTNCAHDPDARVRAAALNALFVTGARTPQVRDAYVEALRDPDRNVRAVALASIATWGPEASPALPELTRLAHDADKAFANVAEAALWRIDARAAADAAGWRPIPDDEWGFTAMMPAHVDVRKSNAPGPKSQAVVHYYDAHDDVNGYMISVGQYPEGFFGAMPLEARLDHARDASLLALAGKAVPENEEAIEFQGRKGKQLHLKLDEKRRMTFRVFCEGDRFYTLLAQTDESLPKEEAAAFFFDSFRFPEN